jgi:pyridoxamine 5'-phosphate oxidase
MTDPIELFREAFERASNREAHEANAMTLATVDEGGRPSARVVLLKSFDARGFVFHTNRLSRKGRELDAQRVAALCFHWPAGEEQVRVEGRVERISDEESDAYFATRPRGSQLGAWASLQSEELAAREVLEDRLKELDERFPGEVPRPPHWGGYRVLPDRIELWKARADRLHERRVFTRTNSSWSETRLYP